MILFALLPGAAAAGTATAVDLQVDAMLVWGAKEEQGGGKLKPADPELQSKLRKSFKWERYYEITNNSFRLAGLKSQRVRMSKKCVVEVERIGDDEVNVKLIGEGKVVVDRRASLVKDESVVLGGPCEGQTAWFVILNFK